jgi:hypothetical protein
VEFVCLGLARAIRLGKAHAAAVGAGIDGFSAAAGAAVLRSCFPAAAFVLGASLEGTRNAFSAGWRWAGVALRRRDTPVAAGAACRPSRLSRPGGSP